MSGPEVLEGKKPSLMSIRPRRIPVSIVNRQLAISVLTNPGSTCRQFMPHQPSIVSGLIIFVGSGLTWTISQPYQNPLSKDALQFYPPRECSKLKMQSVSPSTSPNPLLT